MDLGPQIPDCMHAGGSVRRSYRLRGLQGVTPKLAFLHSPHLSRRLPRRCRSGRKAREVLVATVREKAGAPPIQRSPRPLCRLGASRRHGAAVMALPQRVAAAVKALTAGCGAAAIKALAAACGASAISRAL